MIGEKQEAYGLEAFRPENVTLFGCLHAASDDLAADRAAADAIFEQKLLLLDGTWAADNGGIRETVATTGITVAQGNGSTAHPTSPAGRTEATTDVVITLARAAEDSATVRMLLPVVLYKGDVVPLSNGTTDGIIQIGDLKSTGELVIVVKNASLTFGGAAPSPADWAVHLVGGLRCLKSVNGPSVDLPITETEHSTLGTTTPSVKRRVQDGAAHEMSFTVFEHKGRLRVPFGKLGILAEVLNKPGEDIEAALFGTVGWTAAGKNLLTYQPTGYNLAFMLVEFSSEALAGTIVLHEAAAADAGKVFCKIFFMYGCELTKIDAPSNVEAGSDQLIERSFTVKPRAVYEKVILTLNP